MILPSSSVLAMAAVIGAVAVAHAQSSSSASKPQAESQSTSRSSQSQTGQASAGSGGADKSANIKSKNVAAHTTAMNDCPKRFEALNADQQISQREEAAVRKSVFHALDTDSNDVVSRDEYVRCLASTPAFLIAGVSGRGGHPDATGLLDRSETRFSRIDRDNSKSLSWSEYMAAAEADYKRFGKGSGLTAQSAPAAAGWAFARLDENRDGQLSRSEWQGDVGFAEIGGASFDALDTNRDKNLGADEFTNRR